MTDERLHKIDAFEIKGNMICRDYDGSHYYEETKEKETPDVWTVYGHLKGEGTLVIADCETDDMAEFVQHAIALRLGKTWAQVHWFTERPEKREG